MCGRFTNHLTWEQIVELYEITNTDYRPNLRPNYNIAPTQTVPVVRQSDDGNELVLMRWGFERHWAKNSIINATAEKVAKSSVFRGAFDERRCVVPADGFFEWKSEDGKRQPYRITLVDERPFAFAGIWDKWKADKEGKDFAEGDEIETFCIITTTPNAMMKSIHRRMPVILDDQTYDPWLDGSGGVEMLAPYESDQMTAYKVSTRVNSVKNNDVECVTPL